jgi:hypothetical protein
MPLKATYCTSCSSHQGLRGYIGISDTALALLVALATALASLYTHFEDYRNRNSNTTIAFVSGEQNVIHARAWNTGRKQSILRDYHLVANDLGLQPLLLTPIGNSQTIVPPNGDVAFDLQVDKIEPKPGFNLRNALGLIGARRVTLLIDVQESTGPNPQRHDFESERIRNVLEFKLR